MSQYDDTNRGALFKNTKKESDTHPDYTGTINVDGTEYWLSSWIKKSKAGQTFMSMSVKRKDGKNQPPRRHSHGDGGPDSDTPF